MSTPPLNDDFLDMLVALDGARVEFVIVGAHALAAHGIPRATGDIDILVRPSSENAERVVRALRDFGAPFAEHGVSKADFAIEGTVYQIGLPPRRIDILTSISGIGFDEIWRSRMKTSISGQPVSVIGKSEMIKNKRAAGRAKDLADADALAEKD